MSIEAHTSRTDYRAMHLFTGYPTAQRNYSIAITASFEHFRKERKGMSAVTFVYPRVLRVRPLLFEYT